MFHRFSLHLCSKGTVESIHFYSFHFSKLFYSNGRIINYGTDFE